MIRYGSIMVAAGTFDRTSAADLLVELTDECLGSDEYLGFHCKIESAYHSMELPERKAIRLRISKTDSYGGAQPRGVVRDGHVVLDCEAVLFLAALMLENKEVRVERTGASRLLAAVSQAIAEARIIEDEEI